jgi:hypothetical protein
MSKSALVVLAAAVAIAGMAQAAPAPLTGVWGGDQTILTLRANGGSLESSCAQGQIKGPVVLDDKGQFAAEGSFQTFRGGPQREDETGAPRAAFTGKVDGDTLVLTIQGDGPPRRFSLTRDARPRLLRCL